jgi:hypothetical protein
VRALHYFGPVIDELQEESLDDDYVEYLWAKLRPLVEAKSRVTP